MSTTPTPKNPMENIPFEPSGKVTGFSGAGTSAQFERSVDAVKAQLDQLTLDHAMRGIETVNMATQGPVQNPGRGFRR